jgi:hypothetical protein
VNSIFMPLVLCLTVFASVSFGILAAYLAVLAIFASFGHAPKPEPARPQLVLVASQHPASGD